FVRASADANGVAVQAVAADLTSGAVRRVFDLVLLAEVLYERDAFPAVARAVADGLGPTGLALVADGGRIDTRAFYPERSPLGLRVETTRHRVVEDGFPETVVLSAITWSERWRAGHPARAYRGYFSILPS